MVDSHFHLMFTRIREHDQSCTIIYSYVKRTKTGKLHVMAKTETLPAAIGKQARALRLEAGLTLDDVAKRARLHGLKWAASRVGEFENGKLPVTVVNALVVCAAISEAVEVKTGAWGHIKLVDLLPEQGLIELTPKLTVDVRYLRDAFKGHDVDLFDVTKRAAKQAEHAAGIEMLAEASLEIPKDVPASVLQAVLDGHGLTEQRAAASLGLTELQLVNVEAVLWGTSLSQERARRGGSEASAQKLGQITRALKAEILEHRQSNGGRHGAD